MTQSDSRPMRFDDTEHERRHMAVTVARLQEKVETLGREMADLKKVNGDQSEKLTQILQQLSEARGGLRATLWFGGAMASFGGLMAWAIEHLIGKAHP